jgi:hypothetical protein
MNWKVKNDFIGIQMPGKGAITVLKADFSDEHLAVLKARAKNRGQDEAAYLMKVGLVPESKQAELFTESMDEAPEEKKAPKKRSKK